MLLWLAISNFEIFITKDLVVVDCLNSYKEIMWIFDWFLNYDIFNVAFVISEHLLIGVASWYIHVKCELMKWRIWDLRSIMEFRHSFTFVAASSTFSEGILKEISESGWAWCNFILITCSIVTIIHISCLSCTIHNRHLITTLDAHYLIQPIQPL